MDSGISAVLKIEVSQLSNGELGMLLIMTSLCLEIMMEMGRPTLLFGDPGMGIGTSSSQKTGVLHLCSGGQKL